VERSLFIAVFHTGLYQFQNIRVHVSVISSPGIFIVSLRGTTSFSIWNKTVLALFYNTEQVIVVGALYTYIREVHNSNLCQLIENYE
jgi:hypothetical protein